MKPSGHTGLGVLGDNSGWANTSDRASRDCPLLCVPWGWLSGFRSPGPSSCDSRIYENLVFLLLCQGHTGHAGATPGARATRVGHREVGTSARTQWGQRMARGRQPSWWPEQGGQPKAQTAQLGTSRHQLALQPPASQYQSVPSRHVASNALGFET